MDIVYKPYSAGLQGSSCRAKRGGRLTSNW
jgi:hypothetical protein